MAWMWSMGLHRELLADSVRNKMFSKAFKKVIQKGKTTVTDIGSGTGFLSFVASRAGAKEVNLYECILDQIISKILDDEEIIELSKLLASNNRVNNITFMAKHTSEIKMNEIKKTDIVVSETLGSHALEENLIENMRDAKKFLSNPKKDENGNLISGILIPGKLFQYIAPVTGNTCFKQLNAPWDRLNVDFGLDFEEAKLISLGNMFKRIVPPEDIWKGEQSVQCCDELDFYKLQPTKPGTNSPLTDLIRESKLNWKIDTPNTNIYGFCLWWKVELVPGVELSTSPFEPMTHWEQVYLPLMQPLQCEEKDQVSVALRADLSSYEEVGLDFRWQVQLQRGEKVVKFYESFPGNK